MYSPWAGYPEGRNVDIFLIGAEPKSPHTTVEVENAILAEIEKFKTEPVTKWELERVRNSLRMSQIRALTSNEWLAYNIADGFAMRGDWRVMFDDYDRLMAVTADDVMRVAYKYFTVKNMTVGTLVSTNEEELSNR